MRADKDKPVSRAESVLSSLLLVFAAVVLVVCIISLFAKQKGSTPKFFGVSIVKILTGSMSPLYEPNDALIVKSVAPEELKEGDVISFYSSDPELRGALNTHRLVEIKTDGSTPMFVTKGDANPTADAYDVYPQDVLGRVVYRSGLFSLLIRAVTNKWIFFVLILVPLYVICAVSFRDFTRLMAAREMEKLEREERERKEREDEG